MKQVLIIIDMQNDFITGSLGTPEARAIVPNVVEKITDNRWDHIIITKDTHYDNHNSYNYDDTLEGKKLPIKHCIVNTPGWALESKITHALHNLPYLSTVKYLTKPTFGSLYLSEYLRDEVASSGSYYVLNDCDNNVHDLDIEVEICGLCTDICVISNALLLRAAFPNMKITCDSSCCAGVTPEKHQAALEVMRSCQIDVI